MAPFPDIARDDSVTGLAPTPQPPRVEDEPSAKTELNQEFPGNQVPGKKYVGANRPIAEEFSGSRVPGKTGKGKSSTAGDVATARVALPLICVEGGQSLGTTQ